MQRDLVEQSSYSKFHCINVFKTSGGVGVGFADGIDEGFIVSMVGFVDKDGILDGESVGD